MFQLGYVSHQLLYNVTLTIHAPPGMVVYVKL